MCPSLRGGEWWTSSSHLHATLRLSARLMRLPERGSLHLFRSCSRKAAWTFGALNKGSPTSVADFDACRPLGSAACEHELPAGAALWVLIGCQTVSSKMGEDVR